MKMFVVEKSDAKVASIINTITDGTEVEVAENQVLIKSADDLQNLSMAQLLSLHNTKARERGERERTNDWKNKSLGAKAVYALLLTEEVKMSASQQRALEEAAERATAKVEKTAPSKKKPLDIKKEKLERKKKPDTKRAKLIQIFVKNPGKHLDRAALMGATGFSEGALITNISKLRTDYHAKGVDVSQGGVEVTFGMNINKHKETQTWTYDADGNGDTNFQESRVKEALALLKKTGE